MTALPSTTSAQSVAPDTTCRPLYYVLSAGRTGTLFLESLVRQHCPEVMIEHEPSPSRYLMMLGNLRNDLGILHGATLRLADHHRRGFHYRCGKQIEVNPFLCAVTDLLSHPTRPLRIVHIVRSPGDWAQSMSTFKASTRYRHMIDYVPFAKPFPVPRPAGWGKLTSFEKNLHRWIWCNRRIAALEPVAEAYVLVRSEDIFSGNEAQRDDALARIFEVLDLPRLGDLTPDVFNQRVNPSPAGVNLRNADTERGVCGPAAAEFGYDI